MVLEFYEDYYGSPDYGGGYAMDPYTDDFYNMGYDDGFGFGPRGGLRGRPMVCIGCFYRIQCYWRSIVLYEFERLLCMY